jgi:Ca-activated chloride channel homolog
MDLSEGKAAVAVSKGLKTMKEEATESPRPEAVRSAAGRWFHWQGQAWVDSEAGTARRVVKVKAFSPAYFALLKARPELGPAMALGPRVVLVLGKGVSVSVSPDDGEERPEPIWELLR